MLYEYSAYESDHVVYQQIKLIVLWYKYNINCVFLLLESETLFFDKLQVRSFLPVGLQKVLYRGEYHVSVCVLCWVVVKETE